MIDQDKKLMTEPSVQYYESTLKGVAMFAFDMWRWHDSQRRRHKPIDYLDMAVYDPPMADYRRILILIIGQSSPSEWQKAINAM